MLCHANNGYGLVVVTLVCELNWCRAMHGRSISL